MFEKVFEKRLEKLVSVLMTNRESFWRTNKGFKKRDVWKRFWKDIRKRTNREMFEKGFQKRLEKLVLPSLNIKRKKEFLKTFDVKISLSS